MAMVASIQQFVRMTLFLAEFLSLFLLKLLSNAESV